jgi:hypothetical protein
MGDVRRNKGVSVRETLIGRGVKLEISAYGRRYLIAHDEMLDWIARNKPYLGTRSWKEGGHYFIGKPPRDMIAFLSGYEI